MTPKVLVWGSPEGEIPNQTHKLSPHADVGFAAARWARLGAAGSAAAAAALKASLRQPPPTSSRRSLNACQQQG